MTDLIWLLIALPAVGAAVLVFLGRRLGEPGAGWLATVTVAASFAFAVVSGVGFVGGTVHPATVELFSWIPALGVDATLLWDPLAVTMTLVVTGVGALIHLYAIGYMHGDPRFGRFFAYLNLFIASMLTLVLAGNFAVMFVGWELVGLSSYLLISFWFERPSAAAAGKKAFIVNRIGDWGFLVALMVIFAAFGTLDFGTVFGSAPEVLSVGTATVITLLLLVGATGKSAQLPLYVWLPDAMEGPTPVSALIHAATMVTAGVYMIARTGALFELAPVSQAIVATVGVLTALFAATIAISQRDIKRVLAYSTISQIGYMIFGVGMAAYTAGMFHLVTHAFFKALLFLGAGSVIHALGGEQDMRKMGGLRTVMPVTFWTMVIAWLAISGVFPLAGFWSKDEILGAAFAKGGLYTGLWAIGLFTAFLTAFYMTRWLAMTFLGEPRWSDDVHPHESPWVMTGPLVILAFASTFAGALNTPWRLALERFLEPSFELVTQSLPPESIGVVAALAGLSLVLVVLGIVVAWRRYTTAELPAEAGRFWYVTLHGYWVDDLYGRVFVLPGKALSAWFAAVLDGTVIDGIVNGLGRTVRGFGAAMSTLQSGWVRSYAAVFGGGVLVLLVWTLVHGGVI